MTNNLEYEKLCERLKNKEITFEKFDRLGKQIGLEKTQER